jgi:hypothetical protein
VRIPLHDLLLRLRQRTGDDNRLFGLWSRVWSSTVGYRVSVALARVVLRMSRFLPKVGWAKVWARDRALPRSHAR